MGLPDGPVTLTPNQVENLNRKLVEVRHSINNRLALIIAATELLRLKPDTLERMSATLLDEPQKITAEMRRFSDEFERVLCITK
jgi:hypothetical protein